MTFKTILTASAAAIAATGALAGSPEPAPMEPQVIEAAPMMAPTADWSGGYVGGQLGYGFGELNLDPRDVDELDSDGVIGGFHAGYLWDFGNWVAGPEIQYDFADLSVTDEDGSSGSFDEILRLKGRVGHELGTNGLLYGSAGFAYANFDGVRGVDNIDFDDPGYVIGFGYDHKVSEQWVVGAEYQHHRFNDFGFDGNDVDLGTVHVRTSFNF